MLLHILSNNTLDSYFASIVTVTEGMDVLETKSSEEL